jgi:hypothetical protein
LASAPAYQSAQTFAIAQSCSARPRPRLHVLQPNDSALEIPETMDFYTYWLIRSRVVSFVGAIAFIGSIWIPVLRDWRYSSMLTYVGMIVLAIGLLDASTLIQREKVRRAIKDHKLRNR